MNYFKKRQDAFVKGIENKQKNKNKIIDLNETLAGLS